MHNLFERRFFFVLTLIIALCVPVGARAESPLYHLSTNETGGDCSLIGSWNPDTKTCTLTGDVAGGIAIIADSFHFERTSGITIDGAGHTLRGDGTGNGIYLYYTNGITIKNITIDNFVTGVHLQSAGQAAPLDVYTVIDAVTITNTKNVLLDAHSHRTRVTNLTADTATILLSTYYSLDLSLEHVRATNINGNIENPGSVNGGGVRVGYATERTVFSDVSLSGGALSFEIRDARDIRMRGVSLSGVPSDYSRIDGNQRGTFFRIDGNEKEHYRHDIDASNTINGHSILYHKDSENVTIDARDASIVICVSCTNVAIAGATIDGAYQGILLYDTHRSRVENSSISKAASGLTLIGSTENTITQNSFSNNWSHVLLTPSQKQIGWNYGPVYGLDTHSTGNTFSQNNFESGPVSASPILDYVPNNNTYFSPLPEGGNYWNLFDEAREGCVDANADSFCDAPYAVPNGQGGTIQDAHPRTRPNAWLPTLCTDTCVSNIAFIPGFEASRLYKKNSWIGGEDRLWEPMFGYDVAELHVEEGESAATTSVYTRDVLDNFLGRKPIYESFLAFLTLLKTQQVIKDFNTLPYDWRFDPRDVIAQGVQYENEVRRMETKIEELAATSKTGKVTIVAHSMGGHVAKVLVDKLKEEGKADLIDRIIFVATPHLGTPKAIAGLLHGDGQEIPGDEDEYTGVLVSPADARSLGLTLPSAHNLLPSAGYFGKVFDPVVDLTRARSLQTDALGTYLIRDYESLATFLAAEGSPARTQPNASDVNAPAVLNEHKLLRAKTLHDALDAWTPPQGITTVNIAGWGLLTMRGIAYSEKQKNGSYLYHHDPLVTAEGDATVVYASAQGEGERYFVDLFQLEKDLGEKREHVNILESTPVRSLIKNLITHTATTSPPEFISTTKPELSVASSTLRLSVYSPADLHLYDSGGRHTGRIPSDDGFIHYEEEIPGTTYMELGESKHIIAPEGSYRSELQGTGEGTFDFIVRTSNGGSEETPRATYTDVPVSLETIATVSVSPNVPLLPLSLDTDGDGTEDESILPQEADAPTFPELLALFRTKADTLATSPATKNNLLLRASSTNATYQKLLTLRETRKEKRSALSETFDARISSSLASFLAYTNTLATLPPQRKRKLTSEQEATLNTLLEEIEASLKPDEETGLPPEAETVHALIENAKKQIQTLSLHPSTLAQITSKLTAIETRHTRALNRLGTFDARTKLAEANLKKVLTTKLTNLSIYTNRLSALPLKNKNRLMAEDATALQKIISDLINLIPSI